jgi:hypothetical protein
VASAGCSFFLLGNAEQDSVPPRARRGGRG